MLSKQSSPRFESLEIIDAMVLCCGFLCFKKSLRSFCRPKIMPFFCWWDDFRKGSQCDWSKWRQEAAGVWRASYGKWGSFIAEVYDKKNADLNFYQLTLEVKCSSTYIPPNLLPDFYWVGHSSTKSKKTHPGGDELVRLMLAYATWVVQPIPPLWRWGCMVVDCWRKSWTCSRFEEICREPRKGFKDCLLVCF